MTRFYLLAEKPSQAKAYAEAFTVAKRDKTHIELEPCSTFPEGAVITWGIGHLVSLKMPNEYKEEWSKWDLKNLPIIPERFEFKTNKEKLLQFNAIKTLFNECQTGEKICLVNCADIDREGANIFYSIYNMTGTKNKNIKRLWINSLEVEEVRKGFNNLLDNKKDLLMYEEAKTRQIADWLVGINASQLFSLLLNTSLSVGRVQSPTVYMIYQRQKEIENFVSKPFYELFAEFTHENGTYSGKSQMKEDKRGTVIDLLNRHDLSSLKHDKATIKDVTKQLKKIKSPQLHSLSTLQTKANRLWKYSPAKVLEVVQTLYEKKIMTYPRTDCNYITESEFEYLSNNVGKYQSLLGVSFEANLEKNKRFVDNQQVQEHFAIVPTKTTPTESTLSSLTEEERNIFYEVLKTTLGIFHSDYEFEETTIVTDVKNIEFLTKGKVEVSLGWKSLFSNEKDEDEPKTDSVKVLPSVSKRDLVLSSLEVKEGHTSPPKPFTEGGLITLMKTAGKMVDDEADSQILKEIEGIGTEATRSGIIETIKKNDYIHVKKNIVSVTDKGIILCEAIKGNLLSSPSMTAQWESYLKKIGEGKGSMESFLANVTKFLNKTIDEAPKMIKSSGVSQAIKQQQQSITVGTCPVCKKGGMVDRKTFYSCSEYQNNCNFSVSKTIASKKLTQKNIIDLLEKSETSKIKGFKSKAGKPFDAMLVIEKGKVGFKF
ncbi:DNA topoisomerase III [Sporosarcina siberiensis]|uniref:DNA topoisomerase n=1 Tax=Sporosarcina siberiensis TaxID=1365606 RepID=A0ABW4SDD1_9BACL